MPRPRPMISYAQNLEDVLLDRVLADVEEGFYVDVGAYDPDHGSVTRHFYDHGWRGINIEPGIVFEKLCRARPRDVNLKVAISTTTDVMPFHEYPEAPGLSTLLERPPDVPADRLAGRFTREVRVRPLRDVLAQHQPPTIDFMSIDVEGHEREVLLSNDWSRWRPRVLVVEAILPLSSVPCHQIWEDVVLEADYLYAAFDGVNRYYVRCEDEQLLASFAAPVNVLDSYTTHQVTRLSERSKALKKKYQRLDHELCELRRGTGARTLRIGLGVARALNRLARLGAVGGRPFAAPAPRVVSERVRQPFAPSSGSALPSDPRDKAPKRLTSERAPKQLWIDVGPLFRHAGNMAGSPRVAISLAREWLADPDLPLRFCGYDLVQGHYREVDRRRVEEQLVTFGTARDTVPDQRAPRRAAPTRAPPGPSPPVDAALAGFAPEQVSFRTGDVLFLPLNTWGWPGIIPVLADLHDSGGVRLVPMIYDVIPLSQPHLVHPRKRLVYEGWLVQLLGRSAAVITISECSRREILEQASRLALPAPPVEVVRLGDQIPSSGQPRCPREFPASVEDGFVLCVGSISERKNQQLLYRAWRELVRRHGDRVPRLVLVGHANQAMGEALLVQMRHDPFLHDRLFILDDASDPEMQWLLERCLFTMFPSQYEGWGLPVAESLACGKYCVCSSAAALPEIARDLIDYHDPLSLPACLELVERALFTPGFLSEREDRIRRQFRVTSWKSCAEQVLRVVREPWLQTGPRSSRNGLEQTALPKPVG